MSSSLARQGKISPPQLRQVWGLLNQLAKASGQDADELKIASVQAVTGQSHLSLITPTQADALLGHLRRELAKYTPKSEAPKPDPKGRAGTISPRQQRVLTELYRQAGYETAEAKRTLSERQCGKPWPQTKADADKIYEALSAMVLRRNPAEKLLARVDAIRGHDALDAFERPFLEDLRRQLVAGGRMSPGKIGKLVEAEMHVAAAMGVS